MSDQTHRDQLLRADRRASLRNLLARTDRAAADGVHLTSAEAYLLRERVETEIREADTMRAVSAGNKRHVQYLYGEFQQAQAAIMRARNLVERAAGTTNAGLTDYDVGQHELARAVLDTLTEPEPAPGPAATQATPDAGARHARYAAVLDEALALVIPNVAVRAEIARRCADNLLKEQP